MSVFTPNLINGPYHPTTARRTDGVEDNLALSCQGCNSHKASRTEAIDPVTGSPVPLFNPRQQRWRDPFAWSEDHLSLVGLTPIGWATVETLRLNREGLVNMRRVLYAAGEHPPQEAD